MTKNLIIALLAGIIIGQVAHADTPSTSITRADLFDAAALCGILANYSHDPFGTLNLQLIRSPKDYAKLAKDYSKRFTQ